MGYIRIVVQPPARIGPAVGPGIAFDFEPMAGSRTSRSSTSMAILRQLLFARELRAQPVPNVVDRTPAGWRYSPA